MGSLVAVSSLKLVFGWWDWDAEAPALVNRVTGERVVFRGAFQDPDLVPSDESWLRFDYEHPELNFPLLVEERPAEDAKEKGKTVWRVDYGRSHALFNHQGSGKDSNPSYGVWRRLDDCVSDAFACWPEDADPNGALARDLFLFGGWLNGVWSEGFNRSERRTFSRDRVPSENDYDSWLVPLDEAPPSPFVFHDHIPRRNGTENWEIENPVLLEGLEFEVPKFRLHPRLPSGKPLTGLEGRTAYLLSVDEKCLLYPCYGSIEADRGRGHWSPSIYLIYADDVSVSLIALKSKKRDQRAFESDWLAILSAGDFSLRQESCGSPFRLKPHPDTPAENKMFVPSRPLWLRVRWGLIDGWSRWAGSRARNAAWLQGLDLFRAKSTTVLAGYRGGKWGSGAAMTALEAPYEIHPGDQ